MKVAVIGPRGYASFRIRGKPLAAVHSWDCLDIRKRIECTYDVIWLVKRHSYHSYSHVRSYCDKLVFDPLDFWHPLTVVDPSTCWRNLYNQMTFNAIVSTSPACRESMKQALNGTGVPIHMLPHQCDAHIKPEWYDPDGPIVYAGAYKFINGYVETIEAACELIGREFRFDYSQHHGKRVLQGASLILALRARRTYSCEFTRHCKPQIKIENAAAMGAPVLCSGHPAEISLHQKCHVATEDDFGLGPVRIATLLKAALTSQPPSMCYRPEHFFADAIRVIESLETGVEIVNYGETVDCQTVAS